MKVLNEDFLTYFIFLAWNTCKPEGTMAPIPNFGLHFKGLRDQVSILDFTEKAYVSNYQMWTSFT